MHITDVDSLSMTRRRSKHGVVIFQL